MANLSQYYPAPIIAGSVTGTYADGGRAALKDLQNTYTDNQTYSGTANVAPNQTAASGSSLMTRDLVEARKIVADANAQFITPTSYFGNRGGTNAAGISRSQAAAINHEPQSGGIGTFASSLGQDATTWALWQVGVFIHSTSSGASVNFNTPFTMAFRCSGVQLLNSIPSKYYLGIAAAWANGVPSGRGCGIVFDGLTSGSGIALWSHDGTTLTQGSVMTGPTTVLTGTGLQTTRTFLLVSNGAGTLSCYFGESGSFPTTLCGTATIPTTGSFPAQAFLSQVFSGAVVSPMGFQFGLNHLKFWPYAITP